MWGEVNNKLQSCCMKAHRVSNGRVAYNDFHFYLLPHLQNPSDNNTIIYYFLFSPRVYPWLHSSIRVVRDGSW